MCKQESLPAPCRVKITKCSFPQGWYRHLIGEEFDVDNAGGNYDYVLWDDMQLGYNALWRHISKSDCEKVSLLYSKPTADTLSKEIKKHR